MNDDFLRSTRRLPSAAFERQLRERLRQQELSESPERHPSWKLLVVALLMGSAALATATYLTLTRDRTPAPLSTRQPMTQPERVTHESPGAVQNITREPNPPPVDVDTRSRADLPIPSAQQGSVDGTRANVRSSADSASASGTETTRYISSTGPNASTAAVHPIRVVASQDIVAFAKPASPGANFWQSASFEVNSADKVLPTLCAQSEPSPPDLVVTSRRARRQELRPCKETHAHGVLETTLGHIAIVVTGARAGMPMQLSTHSLRRALLKKVPAPDNSSLLIDNPYTHWNQIDPALEERRIEVLGPARDTPEFIVFAAAVLAPACESNASLDPQLCQSVREDGVYAEAQFDSNFVPQRLWSDPDVVAIMDYQFYVAHSSDLLGSLLPGPQPTRESILDGSYAGARTLHAYVNRERYRNSREVSAFINEYLRRPAYLNHKVVIPPDGHLRSRRPFDGGLSLTEVKLE